MSWVMPTRANGMATSRHPPSTLATPAACAARPSSTHTAAYGSSTTSSAAVPSASSQITHPSVKSSPKSAPKHGAASTQKPGREHDHRRQRAQRRPSQPLPAIPCPLARLRPTKRRHPRPPRHRSHQHPHRPAQRHPHGTVPRQDRVSSRLKVYIEPRDIWVGAYVAPHAIYVCPLPFLVIRWERPVYARVKREFIAAQS